MPLSLFIDALPYNEMKKNYSNWFENIQIAELQPNIAYSSSLHWQLYCNKYPDDRGVLVDWARERETRFSVRLLSKVLMPFDLFPSFSIYIKKVLDRIVYRKNVFANIPFKFRSDFSEKSVYLFWDNEIYSKEMIFHNYKVISQDEGHLDFKQLVMKADEAINSNYNNIHLVIGSIDAEGHKCRRGDLYSKHISPYMIEIRRLISKYLELHPEEEVLIISDHGMSTVNDFVDPHLEHYFGRQSKKTYIAYCDSAVMCIWIYKEELKEKMVSYLSNCEYGHLLSNDERIKYRATNPKFGDLIFILREGNCFQNSWFGKSKREHPDGIGMHGFWPEKSAKDQMASIVLINGKNNINTDHLFSYPEAHELIKKVML